MTSQTAVSTDGHATQTGQDIPNLCLHKFIKSYARRWYYLQCAFLSLQDYSDNGMIAIRHAKYGKAACPSVPRAVCDVFYTAGNNGVVIVVVVMTQTATEVVIVTLQIKRFFYKIGFIFLFNHKVANLFI